MVQSSIQFTVQLNINTKEEEYCWEFIVPPRSQLRDYESQNQALNQATAITFNKGLLASVKHKGTFYLTSSWIKATLELPLLHKSVVKWSTKSCNIKFYSHNELRKTLNVNVTKRHCGSNDTKQYWDMQADCGEECWNDSVNRIRVYFLVEQTTSGIIESSRMEKETSFSMEMDNKSESNYLSKFFLSKELSDIKFTCEGMNFPSHKVILSGRSSVFSRMLNSSSGMTEAKDGNIQITDMKSNVLKEMLRYMYCGMVENMEDINHELIIAADKYDLTNLKALCEKSLIGQLNVENALSFYSLAESINAKKLMKISLDLIEVNKSAIFKDSTEFLQFTNRHPEVTLQLLKM